MGYPKQHKGTKLNILEEARKTRSFSFTHNVKHLPFQTDYKKIVEEWEAKTNKCFGETIAELRMKHSPEEVINILGVSRGFIYYNYGLYMNRIAYLEHTHKMPLGDLINQMREQGKTMDQISEELCLAKTTLYNHLKKTG